MKQSRKITKKKIRQPHQEEIEKYKKKSHPYFQKTLKYEARQYFEYSLYDFQINQERINNTAKFYFEFKENTLKNLKINETAYKSKKINVNYLVINLQG